MDGSAGYDGQARFGMGAIVVVVGGGECELRIVRSGCFMVCIAIGEGASFVRCGGGIFLEASWS